MEPGSKIPTEGLYNLRDLGGYPGAEGKRVKPRLLLRGDDLYPATPRDLEFLANLPLRTVVDFRDQTEKRTAPDRLPPGVERYAELPIEVGNILDIMNLARSTPAGLMTEVYVSLARDCTAVYREFMAIAADESAAPLLYHCTAGKDRTGFATALLLAALGTPRDIILADYRRSTDYIRPKYADYLAKNPDLTPLLECRVEYLAAAFDCLDREFGGLDAYLVTHLRADLPKLRRLYLLA